MRRALAVARTTPVGDIPVGAVIFAPDGSELATGTNRREADGDPTAHAEVVAIRRAAQTYGDGWRLTGCELVVTLEPCVMCAGAAVGARVDSIVFGAWEPRTGACGSLVDAVRAPGAMHVPEVRGGVLGAETAELLSEFFETLRS
ncbi:nucleoside deaminase [Corynebacterium uterequi]|nr:nucleoside deaminase [Corynebacterium uterequi]